MFGLQQNNVTDTTCAMQHGPILYIFDSPSWPWCKQGSYRSGPVLPHLAG